MILTISNFSNIEYFTCIYVSIIFNNFFTYYLFFYNGTRSLILLIISLEVLNLQTAVLSLMEQPQLSRGCFIFLV
jgi:hypothetical protein